MTNGQADNETKFSDPNNAFQSFLDITWRIPIETLKPWSKGQGFYIEQMLNQCHLLKMTWKWDILIPKKRPIFRVWANYKHLELPIKDLGSPKYHPPNIKFQGNWPRGSWEKSKKLFFGPQLSLLGPYRLKQPPKLNLT